jgi:hypothetical protein
MGSLKVDKNFFINRATRIYEHWVSLKPQIGFSNAQFLEQRQ